jgi:hypothetical protein
MGISGLDNLLDIDDKLHKFVGFSTRSSSQPYY